MPTSVTAQVGLGTEILVVEVDFAVLQNDLTFVFDFGGTAEVLVFFPEDSFSAAVAAATAAAATGDGDGDGDAVLACGGGGAAAAAAAAAVSPDVDVSASSDVPFFLFREGVF